MNHYNNERTNQGKNCNGKTPMETFLDGYKLYEKYVFQETSNNCETIIEDRPIHTLWFEKQQKLEDEVPLKNFKSQENEVTNAEILD